ncbi:MAG: ATP-binding protein [Candidatus Omnitrophota bacterium]|nr:ATP-binding protein [Candidatus Omnitrophota bacterium]
MEVLFKKIFGRENILSLLNRRVLDLKDGYRQNIAILGNAFIGKSAILQEFVVNLSSKAICPIYIEIDKIDFSCFVKKYIDGLLFNFLSMKSLAQGDSQEILLEISKRFIPATVEQIKKINLYFEKGKRFEAYRELISLPEIFFSETGIYCVVILDEFQNLESLGFPFVFQELGKKIMLQRSCLYIVSSSQLSLAKKIISEKLSLLFGNFDLVDIPPFDVKTSQEFISWKLLDIESNCLYNNFLIDFTAGYPFYLDIIFQEVRNTFLLKNEKSVNIDLLAEVLAKLLFEKKGFLNQHFNLVLKEIEQAGFKRGLTQVLLSLSNGQNKLKNISKNLSKEQGHILQKLTRLLELGIISKNGNFYYIHDKLFSFWLKTVYQDWYYSFDYFSKSKLINFSELLKKIINNFCQISQKDLSDRVIELFFSFDNEYFQFNGHRYRLPIFKDIKALKFAGQEKSGLKAMVARNPDLSWLILLNEELVSETDIANFFEQSKKFNLKTEKRILIFIKDIEPNARLKALQQKMWVWNLTNLNLLMNFYHKPYFIK